jgi:hypothetical protein
MKKIIGLISLSLLLSIFCSDFSFAAKGNKSSQWGVKAGLNLANIGGNSAEDADFGSPKTKMGFALGGFYKNMLSDAFALQVELLYSQHGAKYEANYQGSNVKLTLSYDYIAIPVLAKFYIPANDNLSIGLYGGLMSGYKISATGKAEANGQESTDDLNNVQSTVVDLIFGGSIEPNLGNTRLIIDVRYNFGLTSAMEKSIDIKDRTISLTVGLGF